MVAVEPVGELISHPDVPEWLVSSPVYISLLAGTYPFIFDEPPGSSGYGRDVTEAISSFLSLSAIDREVAAHRLFENYCDFVDVVGENETASIAAASDIWSHITPVEIFVSRRKRRDRDIYVQVACECTWEPEHGVQLVFRRGSRLVYVSDCNGHLTKADAYDLPEDIEGT